MRRIQALTMFLVASCLSAPVWGEPTTAPTTMPTADDPVVYWSQQRSNPAMNLFFVRADLTNPKVHVRVSAGGADPDGNGPWQTTLMVPTEVAAREHFDVCVNASFFSARNTKDAEGAKSGYVEGKWASASGAGMTDGNLWSPVSANGGGAVFWIDDAGKGHLSSPHLGLPKDAKQAVQGNAVVLSHDKPVEFPKGGMSIRNPRTVVGLNEDGTILTLMVVDGRNPLRSIGMTGTELGQEMKNAGCTEALNLDGGGSSELLMRDADGKLQVMNHPSDLRERAVADVVGISIDGTNRVESK
jgi:exopolysaccharide biosynthesis protein